MRYTVELITQDKRIIRITEQAQLGAAEVIYTLIAKRLQPGEAVQLLRRWDKGTIVPMGTTHYTVPLLEPEKNVGLQIMYLKTAIAALALVRYQARQLGQFSNIHVDEFNQALGEAQHNLIRRNERYADAFPIINMMDALYVDNDPKAFFEAYHDAIVPNSQRNQKVDAAQSG